MAMTSAFFNLQIPVCLGSITSVLADIIKKDERLSLAEYWEVMKHPALKFTAAITAQAVSTALTISYGAIAKVGEHLAEDLRRELFYRFQQQDLTFFEMHQSGDIIKRINDDVQVFKSDFKKLVGQGIKQGTQAIGLVGVLYSISPQLTVALFGGVGGIVGIGSWLGQGLRKRSKENHRQSAATQGFATETLNNMKTVRSFSAEDEHIKKYDEMNKETTLKATSLNNGIAVFQGLTNLALNGIIGATTIGCGGAVGAGSLSSGDLMSFMVSAQLLMKNLSTLSQIMTAYVKMGISGERVFEHMDLMPGDTTTPKEKIIPRWKMSGDVVFGEVGFSYVTRPEQPVLEDFNMMLYPNKTTALVGTSGNGKSTIAALLARLYDPSKGGIYLDGVNLKRLDPKWLRSEIIGYIGQEPVLFSGSILDNIRYGKPHATDEEVVEAAKKANAHDFIKNFPSGYGTHVGERGTALSGGQKQRIAIARAIIKDPRILILDEATSALDTESERLVQAAFEEAFKDRTVLIIAHRLSTIKNASRIHVVEKGRIVESGTHEELLAKNGAYSRLNVQAAS